MNAEMMRIARLAGLRKDPGCDREYIGDFDWRLFGDLIVANCIDKIETYHIPVGNSAAGEMACEWTYDALKEIRDEIKEHFGVQ